MRTVLVGKVEEGAYLGKPVYDNDGKILLKEGAKLTEAILKKIRNLNILELYIKDEQDSDEAVNNAIANHLRDKTLTLVRNTFKDMHKINAYNNSGKNLPNTIQLDFDAIKSITEKIVDDIISKKFVIDSLRIIKKMDKYTYKHSINVGIMSLVLGIRLNLDSYELYLLFLGSLLHDIGKAFIPKEIMNKEDKLTDEEFQLIKKHTIGGYNYLKRTDDVPIPARIIALQHHEKINGSGYPEGRKGEQISKFGRIVAVVDVYDAITSDRPQRKAMTPNDAIEYIMATCGDNFDYKIVKAFEEVVVPYPEGSTVILSTGETAVVEEVAHDYPLRPKVKIIKSPKGGRIDRILNLRRELKVVIVGVKDTETNTLE
ncbi:MAG: HD-GYP domain-containing protein [Bacillota bacterium]|nr:HD-GYP domain-containing protein [Bacillota bacterium]